MYIFENNKISLNGGKKFVYLTELTAKQQQQIVDTFSDDDIKSLMYEIIDFGVETYGGVISGLHELLFTHEELLTTMHSAMIAKTSTGELNYFEWRGISPHKDAKDEIMFGFEAEVEYPRAKDLGRTGAPTCLSNKVLFDIGQLHLYNVTGDGSLQHGHELRSYPRPLTELAQASEEFDVLANRLKELGCINGQSLHVHISHPYFIKHKTYENADFRYNAIEQLQNFNFPIFGRYYGEANWAYAKRVNDSHWSGSAVRDNCNGATLEYRVFSINNPDKFNGEHLYNSVHLASAITINIIDKLPLDKLIESNEYLVANYLPNYAQDDIISIVTEDCGSDCFDNDEDEEPDDFVTSLSILKTDIPLIFEVDAVDKYDVPHYNKLAEFLGINFECIETCTRDYRSFATEKYIKMKLI